MPTKGNENVGVSNLKPTKVTMTRGRVEMTNGARLALREVTNNVVKTEANRPEQPIKPMVNVSLKDVKPTIGRNLNDTKPKVEPGLKNPASQFSRRKWGVRKAVRLAEVPQLVAIKPELQSRKTEMDLQNRSVTSTITSSSTASSSQKFGDISQDMYNYLRHLEFKFSISKNYLNQQKEVTPNMRNSLINWLNQAHLKLDSLTDTYYLAVGIIDRYLQAYMLTSSNDLRLVGVAAMFLAIKYEEKCPPTKLLDFRLITETTNSADEITTTEQHILKTLDFDLSSPSAIHFSRHFSKSANASLMEHAMTKYFIELASVKHSMVHYLPSIIAAAAVFMTMKLNSGSQRDKTEDATLWSETMQLATKYKLDDLRPVIGCLAKIVLTAMNDKSNVYSKYSSNTFKVALLPAMTGCAMIKMSYYDL